MRPLTLAEVYRQNPKLALAQFMDYESQRYPYTRGAAASVWASMYGLDGKTYGSYKLLNARDLAGRSYEINFYDSRPGILWLDVVHDPRTYTTIPLDEAGPVPWWVSKH